MKLIKEIKRKDGFVLFKRWRLLNLGFLYIDIHEFFLSEDADLTFDRDHFLHNHPRRFVSYIMDGGYVEDFRKDKTQITRILKKGSFNFVGLRCFHRIKALTEYRYCKTLVITTKNLVDWGYLDDRDPKNPTVISNEEYREWKHAGQKVKTTQFAQ